MNYQKMLPPPSQFYSNHQVFYENPEYIDEAESFIDNLSYSESDGFIGAPFVRHIPSCDIQELYVRSPSMVTSSRMLPSALYSRQYMNGQPTLREFADLKPRVPLHLKNRCRINAAGNQSTYVHQSMSGIQRNLSGREQQRPLTAIFNGIGVPRTGSNVITGGSRKVFPNELNRGYTVNPHRVRPSARPSTPTPKRHMSTTSEPLTNYQNRDPLTLSHRNHYPAFVQPRRRTELKLEQHAGQSFEEKGSPIGAECVGDVKKMNSEGDATGCVDVDDLDSIGRMVASLDVEEAEKLSERQKMEIKEMSKGLRPRVPSSVRSLQEKSSVERSDSTTVNDQITDGKQKKDDKFRVTFRKSLDSILNQLENCESSLNAVRARFSVSKHDSRTLGKEPSNTVTEGIFNLKDISEKLGKTDERACKEEEEEREEEEVSVEVPKVRSDNTIEDVSSGFESRGASKGNILDETAALELHRSKSYIVDLIDRALSKELGTVPKRNREQFQGFNPTKAVRNIEMNKRNATHGTENPPNVRIKGEEPSFIKELKKLRWGHFRHIQKEVQRLEELEKFLDNCDSIET